MLKFQRVTLSLLQIWEAGDEGERCPGEWSSTKGSPPNGKRAFIKFSRVKLPAQFRDLKRGRSVPRGESGTCYL